MAHRRLPLMRTPEERNALAERNAPLAWWAANRFIARRRAPCPHYTADDAHSDALAGLLRAAEVWDARRGVTFSTYAHNWMLCWMLRGLEAAGVMPRKRRKAGPRVRTIHRNDAGAFYYDDPAAELDRADEAAHAARLVTDALAAIPRRQARAVRLVRLEGLTLAAAGRRMGNISRERVRQLVAKGLAGMKEALAGEVPS